MKLFNDAIPQLARSGFVHFTAIANEHAGELMLREARDREDKASDDSYYWASHYLAQAASLYEEWGATVKVEQMKQQYGNAVLGNIGAGSVSDAGDASSACCWVESSSTTPSMIQPTASLNRQ